jgi:hypothetical protein
MPGFLLLHIRQCLGNAVQRPFAVHVDHPVPFVNLEAFKWARGISPALLIIASIRPYACLHGSVNNLLTCSQWVRSLVWRLPCRHCGSLRR